MGRLPRLCLCAVVLFLVASCSSSSKKKGTLCSGDGDCGTSLCLAGQCVALTPCSTSSECGAGVCAGGYCFDESCRGDSDCRYGTCYDGYCVRESLVPRDAEGDADVQSGGEDGTTSLDTAETTNPLLKLVPCSPNTSKPANSEDQPETVEVRWDPVKQVYERAKTCGWTCLKGFCNQNGEVCLKDTKLPCDPNNNSPLHAIDAVLDVVVQCLPDGTFEKPNLCEWSCEQGFCRSESLCLDEKTLPCAPNAQKPLNAIDKLVDVVLSCLPDGTFEKPPICDWICDTSYCRNVDACEKVKSASCDPNNNNPLNSVDLVVDVLLACQNDGSFEAPPPCEWVCNNGYVKSLAGDVCELAKQNCYQIREALPSALDGLYYVDPDGPGPKMPYAVWCDMTAGGVTVEYGIGRFDGQGPDYYGWTVAGATHFLNPVNQLPFMTVYNANMGLRNLQPGFTPGSCCLKNDALPTGTFGLLFGGKAVQPADDTSLTCGAPLNLSFLRFGMEGGTPQYPLAPNFFISNVPSSLPGCSENANPAFFWRRAGAASCAELKALGFPSGPYELRDANEPSGHRVVYCEMVGGNAYEFGVGAGESSYTSWAVVSLLDWQQPTLQAAFVGYYNAAGGMLNLDKQLTTRGTCCFRTATGALGWGLSSVTPFASDGTACDTTAFDGERIHVGLGSSYRPPPLPASFFVSNPPGTAVCSTGDYFAIFARITAF